MSHERPLEVLLASDDRAFLRLAGAVLGNAGHATTRSGVSARRLERLVRLRRPDVLVLDAHSSAVVVAEVCAMLLAAGRPLALVLVCEDGETPETGHSGELPVVARWGAPDSLVQAVQTAAGTPTAATPPLRLV